jgi:protein-L-isoaspartate O-methyltransferase
MEYPSDHYKLVEELKTKNIIKTKSVARVMKEVDRADFTDMLPYTDWYFCLKFK